MKNRIEIKSPLIVLFITIFLTFGSCSKKDTVENKDEEVVKLSETDYEESDQDLMTVDYKDFYDKLSSKGEWIEVKEEDLGIDIDNGSASDLRETQKGLLSYISGVKDAHAEVGAGMFFVWKPSADLAVGITTGEPAVYVPYYNGQWVNTDAGWYFRAPTPAEEIVHHYGRWSYTPAYGWTWVPGRVWAPAWVDWRENNDYVAWSPIPPSVYLVNSILPVPVIAEDRYIVVERRMFLEPYVYRYVTINNSILVSEMVRTNGVMVVNNTVVNRGPDIVSIETIAQKNPGQVKIQKVKDISQVGFSGGNIKTYSPEFNKVKTKGRVNQPVKKPDKFIGSEKKQQNQSEQTGKQNSDMGNKNDGSSGKNNKDNNPKYDKNQGEQKNNNQQPPKMKNNDPGKYDNQKGNTKSGNDNSNVGKNKGNENKGNQDKGNQNKGNQSKGKNKK